MRNEGMKRLRPQHGFSLIGMLLAVAIIGVLLVMALNTYQPVLNSFEQGTGDRPSFRMNISRTELQNLHRAEVMYEQLHHSYATWDQLVSDGMIPRGYTNRATGRGTPFMPYYDIDIQVFNTGFVITATPSMAAGAPEGTPILRIDQEGVIEEVPAE
jgi:prepilin-type N-terminal cleavage/methylation domain-containing protein